MIVLISCGTKEKTEGAINLTSSSSFFDGYPDWSPSEKKLAFVSFQENNYEIYSMDINNHEITRLTNNQVTNSNPAWSPYGTKLVFEQNHGGNNFEIYVMNSDGTNQFRLTHNKIFDGFASWSPDGSKILYQSAINRNDSKSFEIYTMNSDGSNQLNITNNNFYDGSVPSVLLMYKCMLPFLLDW